MAQEGKPSWWGRNWKWVVPLGCLSLVLLALGLVAAVFWLIKSSGAYSEAIERARADCEVQTALGAPVLPGWSVSGSVNVSGPSGHAEFATPLRGTHRSGTLYVTATKTAGEWHFELLQVAPAGRTARIDLLPAGRKRCA